MDKTLRRLIGNAVAHAIVKESSGPSEQLFSVFADDAYNEFFTDGVLDGASAIDIGELKAALAYGAPEQPVVFQC